MYSRAHTPFFNGVVQFLVVKYEAHIFILRSYGIHVSFFDHNADVYLLFSHF